MSQPASLPTPPHGPLAIGTRAPDFALRDQNHQELTLEGLRAEQSVLVVFFPLAFTGTCQGELGYIRDHQPRFENDSVTTVAVSVGPSPTHKVWSSAQGFLFPILSDFWPHGAVAQSYGVFNEKQGIANRGTFLVNPDGIITFSDVVGPGEVRQQVLWDKALSHLN